MLDAPPQKKPLSPIPGSDKAALGEGFLSCRGLRARSSVGHRRSGSVRGKRPPLDPSCFGGPPTPAPPGEIGTRFFSVPAQEEQKSLPEILKDGAPFRASTSRGD